MFEPQGEIHVLALVPQRDPRAPVRSEAGHLLPGRSRHGADQGDRDHLRMRPPGRRHRIGAAAELAIATQERMIALLDATLGERVILFVMDPGHAHARRYRRWAARWRIRAPRRRLAMVVSAMST